MKNREICKALHRFLDAQQSLSDKELDMIADHLDDCKDCKLQAAAFIQIMRGYL